MAQSTKQSKINWLKKHKIITIIGILLILSVIVNLTRPEEKDIAKTGIPTTTTPSIEKDSDNSKQQDVASTSPVPKYSFEEFVGWYSSNKNAIMSRCNSNDENVSRSCLQTIYKDCLRPELFEKVNEDDRANLISNVAIISAGLSGANIEQAQQIYSKWAVKE